MLTFLKTVAAGAWALCQRVLQLILPFFAKASAVRPRFGALLWVLHVIIVAGIVIGLYFLGQYFGWDRHLTNGPEPLRPYWAPILFLLVYTLGWLGYWLWTLLVPEEEASRFPDLDAAWEEAVQALHQARVDPMEAPLFLVLGRPAAGEDGLFNAAQLQLTVKGAPRDPTAPLHVYGNRDGIYVTCASACLLGEQAAILEGERAGMPNPSNVAETAPEGMSANEFATLQAAAVNRAQEALRLYEKAQRERRELTTEEKSIIRGLEQEDRKKSQPYPSLLKNPAELERLTARLEHLCRKIARERRPYCPINGILVLIPYAALATEEEANQTAALCQKDLQTARETLQLNCPAFALLSDLEKAEGARDFLDRFPQDKRQRRLGQRFPLAPDVPASELPAARERSVAWIGESLFVTWVYQFLHIEPPGSGKYADVTRGNAQLYRLMSQMRERAAALGRLIARAFGGDQGPAIMFGGCYVAATGRDPQREQAFVAGVFRRLLENQSYVSWTDEAISQDAEFQSWTRRGYAVISLLILVAIALITYGVYNLSRS